eukprot:7375181-Pyramimonas_sp.AAC.1
MDECVTRAGSLTLRLSMATWSIGHGAGAVPFGNAMAYTSGKRLLKSSMSEGNVVTSQSPPLPPPSSSSPIPPP